MISGTGWVVPSFESLVFVLPRSITTAVHHARPSSLRLLRSTVGRFMSVPQVVIVGRPNVGKSSVLNWLAGVRIAIVDDKPGVTRDRVTHLVCHNDRFFELVDTGGMGIADMDNLTRHIEDQINLAIDSASVILFVVDTRDGMLPLDQDVARGSAR